MSVSGVSPILPTTLDGRTICGHKTKWKLRTISLGLKVPFRRNRGTPTPEPQPGFRASRCGNSTKWRSTLPTFPTISTGDKHESGRQTAEFTRKPASAIAAAHRFTAGCPRRRHFSSRRRSLSHCRSMMSCGAAVLAPARRVRTAHIPAGRRRNGPERAGPPQTRRPRRPPTAD